MHTRHSSRLGRHAAPPAPRTHTGPRGVVRLVVVCLLLPVSMAAAAPHAHTAGTAAEALATTTLTVPELTRREPVASATPVVSLTRTTPGTVASRAVSDRIPAAALRAYQAAEATMRIADPSCRLPWSLLAGIGRVESDHGRRPGPGLGPMQFVPATWALVGVDGDADGTRDPRDLDDAALAAAAYLCAGPGDLSTGDGARTALRSYHHSGAFAETVAAVAAGYGRTVADVPVVEVGLGNPGKGVPVGITDDVARHHRHGPHRHGPHGHSKSGERHGKKTGKKTGHAKRGPAPGAAGPAGDPQPAKPPRGTVTHGPHRHGASKGPRVHHTPPPRPSGRPSGRPNGRPSGTPSGPKDHPDRPDHRPPSPTPEPGQQFTGLVEDCGAGALCLDGYTLSGPVRLKTLVGETVTLVGVVQGDTLVVSRILPCAPRSVCSGP